MSAPSAADPLALAVAAPAALADALDAPEAHEGERDVLELMLRQTRRMLARDVDPARIEARGLIGDDLVAAAAEAGLFGMTIPEAYGGAELSLKAACRVVEEVARRDRSLAIMVGLHAGLGTRPIVELGGEVVRARFLPSLATGERIASFAATEPGAGSDLMAIRTTGRAVAGGIRLDGEKAYVTNGGLAGVFTVLAATPGLGGARAHSLVCVARETAGLRVGAEEDKLGIRASSTVSLHLEGAVAPDDQILGERGKGIDQAHATLAWGRTLMAAGCVGTARAALDATLAHVCARRQFGRAIGDFAATRAHVADMAARLFAMESIVRWVGHALASGQPIDALSTVAKVFCSEGAFAICDRAVQLHGALGFVEPTGVARMLRDCRVTRIFEGANDVLLVRAGAALVATHTPLVHRLEAGLAPSLRDAASAWDGAVARLSRAIALARDAHGVSIVRRQLVLQRLAAASVDLHAAAASLARVASGSGEHRVLLASHATARLVADAERSLASIGASASEETRALAITESLYRNVDLTAPERLDMPS